MAREVCVLGCSLQKTAKSLLNPIEIDSTSNIQKFFMKTVECSRGMDGAVARCTIRAERSGSFPALDTCSFDPPSLHDHLHDAKQATPRLHQIQHH